MANIYSKTIENTIWTLLDGADNWYKYSCNEDILDI